MKHTIHTTHATSYILKRQAFMFYKYGKVAVLFTKEVFENHRHTKNIRSRPKLCFFPLHTTLYVFLV